MLQLITLYPRVRALRAQWGNRDRGATAVEYALIVAVIAMVVVVAAVTLGDNIAQLFEDSADCVASADDCPDGT
jgi:pilus assembly protein Flp/PilA